MIKGDKAVFNEPEMEEEVAYLQNALKADPGNPEYHMRLGRIFLSENMIDEAAREFEKVLKLAPSEIDAYLFLALTVQKYEKPDTGRAESLLERACEIAPGNAEVHLNLAQLYDKLNKTDKAVEEFKNAVKISDDCEILLSAHLGLMAIYKRKGESKKADIEYDAATKIYPDVGGLIKRTDINRITPPPKYSKEDFVSDGLHPPLEDRIRKSRAVIKNLK